MGDAKLTAEERVQKCSWVETFGPNGTVLLARDAINIANELAAAAVAEVVKERDGALAKATKVAEELDNTLRHFDRCARNLINTTNRAEEAEARVAELEAEVERVREALREWCAANDGGDNWALTNAYRRARAALAPQAPPARKEDAT